MFYKPTEDDIDDACEAFDPNFYEFHPEDADDLRAFSKEWLSIWLKIMRKNKVLTTRK